jgi:hypothetical protein
MSTLSFDDIHFLSQPQKALSRQIRKKRIIVFIITGNSIAILIQAEDIAVALVPAEFETGLRPVLCAEAVAGQPPVRAGTG